MLRDAVVILLIKVLAAVLSVSSAGVLARIVSPSQLGVYFVLLSLATVLGLISRLGMKQTVVRFIAGALAKQDEGQARKSLQFVLAIVALGSLLILLSLWFVLEDLLVSLFFSTDNAESAFWVVYFLMVALAFQTPLVEALRGFKRLRLAATYDGLALHGLLLLLLLIYAYVQEGSGVFTHVLLLVLLAYSLNTAFAGGSVFRIWRHLRAGDTTLGLGEVLTVGLPVFVTTLVAYVISQIGLWVVSANIGPEEAAYFGAAQKLVLLLSMPLLVTNLVVQPAIAEHSVRNELSQLQRLLRTATSLALIPSLFAFALILAFSQPIVLLVFGSEYKQTASLLLILALGYVINVWAGPCANVLMLSGYQKAMMTISVFTGAFSVVACFIGANVAGSIGVAVAVSTSIAMQNALAWWVARRAVGVRTDAHMDLNEYKDFLRWIGARTDKRL